MCSRISDSFIILMIYTDLALISLFLVTKMMAMAEFSANIPPVKTLLTRERWRRVRERARPKTIATSSVRGPTDFGALSRTPRSKEG